MLAEHVIQVVRERVKEAEATLEEARKLVKLARRMGFDVSKHEAELISLEAKIRKMKQALEA